MKKIFIILLTAAVSVSAYANTTNTEACDQESFSRGIGIPTSVFIPKGTVGFGASFSYSTYDIGNSAVDHSEKGLEAIVIG